MTYQVIPEEQHSFLFAWNREHEDSPDDGRYAHDRYHDPFSLQLGCKPSRSNDCSHLDDSEWDIEKNGFETRVAERLDDQVSERADTSAGNAAVS